jgi:hypothetical protein
LKIYLLRNGKYLEFQTSPNFPEIPIAQIIPDAIAHAWEVGSLQALEEVESAIAP